MRKQFSTPGEGNSTVWDQGGGKGMGWLDEVGAGRTCGVDVLYLIPLSNASVCMHQLGFPPAMFVAKQLQRFTPRQWDKCLLTPKGLQAAEIPFLWDVA